MGDLFFRHVLVVRNILLSVFQALSEGLKFEKLRSHILGPSNTVSIVRLPFREIIIIVGPWFAYSLIESMLRDCSRLMVRMCTHTQTHRHTDTHTHTHTHAHTHIDSCTDTLTQTHTHADRRIHTRSFTSKKQTDISRQVESCLVYFWPQCAHA